MSSPTIDEVRAALRDVPFPGFSRDIVALGVLRNLHYDASGSLIVELALQSREPNLVAALTTAIKSRLATLADLPAVEVRVQAPAPTRLPAGGRPAPTAEVAAGSAPIAQRIIGVASGKGGVGKSTVAVNLAVSLAQRGRRVGFLDADVHGPSAPLMFGLDSAQLQRADGEGRPLPLEAHGVKVMSMGFFSKRGEAVIWRGPIVGNFIKQLLTEVAWGSLDDLIIDFPPGTGDAQLTISQLLKLSGVVVVTTPNELAVIDAIKAIAMFRKVDVPILGIVENMAFYLCGHCGAASEIFGHGGGQREAAQHDVPLLGRVPIDPIVVADSDSGQPIVVTHPDSAAARVLAAVAEFVDQRSAAIPGPAAGLAAFLERFDGKA